MEELIQEFLASKRQEGLSLTTLSKYEWHLQQMRMWLREAGVVDIGKVNRSLLRRWGAGLYDRWQPATIRAAVVACRLFFAWCVTDGLLEESPAAGLKTPTVKLKLERTMTPEEIGRLLAACDHGTLKGLRDAAIISVLADSGVRSAELLALRVDDVDLDRCELRLVRNGGNHGLGFFGQVTAARLRGWLDIRPARPKEAALFVAVGSCSTGKALTPAGLRIILRELGRNAGIEGVSPHAFRRGWACALVEAGAPNRYIQGAGGWSSERQIYRYTQALELARMASRYSPLDLMDTSPAESDGG